MTTTATTIPTVVEGRVEGLIGAGGESGGGGGEDGSGGDGGGEGGGLVQSGKLPGGVFVNMLVAAAPRSNCVYEISELLVV